MKLAKMLSLATVAAIAAMAFVGTSSAFAEKEIVLCKKAELECKEPWPNPTTIIGHAVTPKVLTSLGTFECEKSTVEITLLNKLGQLELGHILTYTLEGSCHLGSTSCTVTVPELGAGSGTHGPNPLEAVVVAVPLNLESGEMNTVVNAKCGFFVNCTYTFGEETEARITNNASGEVTLQVNESPLKKSKGLCPEVAKIDATYTASGTGLYIES